MRLFKVGFDAVVYRYFGILALRETLAVFDDRASGGDVVAFFVPSTIAFICRASRESEGYILMDRGKGKACYVAFTTASTLLFLPLVLCFLIHSLMQYLALEVS